MKYILFLVFLIITFSAAAQNPSPRTIVHILDYIGGDYPGAVENGKITNPAEYEEQLELLASAKKILLADAALSNREDLKSDFQNLEKLIKGLASASDVLALSAGAKQKIIFATKLQMAPQTWPSLAQGKSVYEANCLSCHGVTGRGDGPGAKDLNPPAADFSSKDRNTFLSPTKVFNTARIGIEGTAMKGFDQLNDEDLWAVAFYIFSLKHNSEAAAPLESWQKNISLEDVSNSSDPALLEKLEGNDEEKKSKLASIRHYVEGSNHNKFIAFAVSNLNQAVDDYKNGKYDLAHSKALTAYLEGVEPIEPKIKAKNPTLLREIETQMLAVRQKINSKQPQSEVSMQTEKAVAVLGQVKQLLDTNTSSPGFTYFLTLSIILREALEALLVIITLLGVLKATGSKAAQKWLHAGWGTAILLGIILWFFSGWIINLSGASRELLEGAVSLFAVVILIYIGFWLHSKTEITKWNSFIKDQIGSALNNKSLLGLALISFTAVARESLEVVLFLRTILIDVEQNQAAKSALYAGMFSSIFFVAIMAWLLLKYSAKVPVRKLFIYSSVVIGLLALTLTGKALHSIQESGKISITPLPFDLRIDALGFYPTAESVGTQILLLLILISLWFIGRKPKLNPAS